MTIYYRPNTDQIGVYIGNGILGPMLDIGVKRGYLLVSLHEWVCIGTL